MLESIGNTIAAALSNLSFVSRAGGITELIDVQNGENRQRIPGAKGYRESDAVFTGKPEDIASMAPDGSETCIAFVDVPPDDALLCSRCEAVAVEAGLPSADSLAGRHVHLGKCVAVQTCCQSGDKA